MAPAGINPITMLTSNQFLSVAKACLAAMMAMTAAVTNTSNPPNTATSTLPNEGINSTQPDL